MHFLFHLLQFRLKLPHLLTQGGKYITRNKIYGSFLPQSYGHHLVSTTLYFWVLEWNGGWLKLNNIVLVICKHPKRFLNFYYSVKYSLQKWISFHTYVIRSRIAKNYIKVKLYDINGGSDNELCHKVLIQVSVCEIHIDILKKDTDVFSMAYC